MDKHLEKIVHKVSLDTFTDKEVVDKVIKTYYLMYKEFLEKASKDNPDSIPKFIIPYVGSLKPNFRKIKRVKEKLNAKNQTGENQS